MGCLPVLTSKLVESRGRSKNSILPKVMRPSNQISEPEVTMRSPPQRTLVSNDQVHTQLNSTRPYTRHLPLARLSTAITWNSTGVCYPPTGAQLAFTSTFASRAERYRLSCANLRHIYWLSTLLRAVVEHSTPASTQLPRQHARLLATITARCAPRRDAVCACRRRGRYAGA